MDTIYICGPMTGYPNFNYPAFTEAAATLRGQGMNVISPHELDKDHDKSDYDIAAKSATGNVADLKQTWGDFLARDVKIVADAVTGIALLPNWQHSKGAKLEVTVALLQGKPVYQYHTGGGLSSLDRTWVKDVLYANL
jgi:nucleoside 2-deoxyribosyltransferase